MNVSYVINELKYFIKCCILNQVVHLCRNEYNSQFAFLVKISVMTITERSLKISQNDYCDQWSTATNDYNSNFNIAFSLKDNSGLY